MNYYIVLVLALVPATFSCALFPVQEIYLTSPNISSHGTWGLFENCSDGNLVTAFSVKLQPKHSLLDDTALNGIRFFCGPPPARPTSYEESEAPVWENITSKVGPFGLWGQTFNCPTYFIGFNLESQNPQGKYKDDVATNVKFICGSSGDIGFFDIEGFHYNGNDHLFPDNHYTGAQRCPTGYGICGLQTQVEGHQALGDDTALNNLRVRCCRATLNDVISG